MREKRPEKPIPNVGDWILATRENETVTLLVTDKDETSKRFQTRVFLSWIDATTPNLGRSATMKFETYQDHRYQPREAPINVHALPASITREQAQEALELEGWTPSTATEVLNDVGENGLIDATHLTNDERAILRAYIGEPAPAVTPPDGMPVTNVTEGPADADTSPVVPAVLTPEPTSADLMAEIKALRADLASLRDELRASKFWWSGECSGGTWEETFLPKIAPKIRGTIEAVVTWEGGDSHTGLRIRDGKVTEPEVVMTLVAEEET